MRGVRGLRLGGLGDMLVGKRCGLGHMQEHVVAQDHVDPCAFVGKRQS